jgi:O-antigen/teichoic acid export membrane protein
MNRKLIKRVFTFSLPLAVKSLFGILMARIDNLMLVFFRPLAEVALYNTIQPTAELLLLFARPFGKILFPMGSELLALDNKKGICFLLKRVHKYLLILFVPALIVILLFSGFLLQLLFGESYSGGALGLQILIFGFLFTGLNIPSYSILLGIGRSKEATYAVIGTNFLNLVLNIILIPLLGKFDIGYIGAILATVFSQLLLFLWVWAYIKRYISYSFPIRDWFLISIIGIALLLIGLIIAQRIYNIYLQIVLVGLVLLILYPLCLWILNVISRKEINDMVNLVKK